jgi:hypothetical protein
MGGGWGEGVFVSNCSLLCSKERRADFPWQLREVGAGHRPRTAPPNETGGVSF